MRMHKIEIFYTIKPNLGEFYLFGDKKLFNKTKACYCSHKTDATVEKGRFLVDLFDGAFRSLKLQVSFFFYL